MTSSAKKLVLFDIDGTLIRHFGREPRINVGWNRFCYALKQVFDIDVTPKPTVNYHGSVDKAILYDIARQYGVTKSDFDANFDAVKAAVIYHAHTNEKKQIYESIPEAVALLQQLRARPDRFILGVLTGNVDRMAQWKLFHVGIDPAWFKIFITSDEFEDRISLAKSTFAKVKIELGLNVAPTDTVVIGDAVGDVRCAKAIGAMSMIALTGKHSRKELAAELPDFLVSTLTDPAVIEYFGILA